MKIPNWLFAVAVIGVLAVSVGLVKIPTLAVTGAALSAAQPSLPAGAECTLQAGQTRGTSITMTGVLLEQEGFVLGTPVYAGAIDGTVYTAQAGGTAVTQDKGSAYSVILYNSSSVVHPYYTEGKIPCGSDNYALSTSGGLNKLAPVGGLTLTAYNDDGITLNSATNQTMGASYIGILRVRMQGNSTYGNSKGYFTNPQINRVAVLVNLYPSIYNATTMNGATTFDNSKFTFSVGGVQCSDYVGANKYATSNLYSKVFDCPATLTSGIPVDAYLGVQAISGQNPAGSLQVIVVPFEYFAGTNGIKAGFENDNGALTGTGTAAGALVTYSIT